LVSAIAVFVTIAPRKILVSEKTAQIATLLNPAIESLGLALWGIEYAPSRGRSLLRIYIDAPDRHVGIEDCERVSREVSALLDVHDPISSEYTLEVSSPGIDRPLFVPAHYARHVGEMVKATLRLPQEGRRRVQGRIVACTDGDVTLQVEDAPPLLVAFDNIEKARLVPDLVALGLAPSVPAGSGGAARPGRPGRNQRKDRGA
jgi:ribosome maturation factor RimP